MQSHVKKKWSCLSLCGFRAIVTVIGLCALYVIATPLHCVAQAKKSSRDSPVGVPRAWYNGNRKDRVWMAEDEFAVFYERGNGPISKEQAEPLVKAVMPSATIEEHNGFVTFLRTDTDISSERVISARESLRKDQRFRYISPVFYPGKRIPESRMALTGEIIVSFKLPQKADPLSAWCKKYGVRVIIRYDFSPNTYLLDARESEDSLALANQI